MENTIDELIRIMARLRDPEGGCPWDVEQTFETIAPYTIEEAYEVDDAIARRDFDALRDELGDLLLQVVYHAQMAREEGRFGFEAVVESICTKLVRRHPHVFGDENVDSAAAQVRAWDGYKEEERAEKAALQGRAPSVLDDVPGALPALLRAAKLIRRARRAGLDDQTSTRLEALRGSAGSEEAVGDLLLDCVRLAGEADVDPETALREAGRRFEARVRDRERE